MTGIRKIQNLESCQLDDLPAVVRDIFSVTARTNKNEPQHVPEFGTATIQLFQIKRL